MINITKKIPLDVSCFMRKSLSSGKVGCTVHEMESKVMIF